MGEDGSPWPQGAPSLPPVLPVSPFPGQLPPLLAVSLLPPASSSHNQVIWGPGEEWTAETWYQTGPWWLQLSLTPRPRFLSSLVKCRVDEMVLSSSVMTQL